MTLRRAVIFANGAIILAFLVLGTAYYVGVDGTDAYWLDDEGNAPAIFSALLLIGAALAGSRLTRALVDDRWNRRAALALTGLFAFMSLDEALHFHERFNDHFGIPWQLPYAPILLGAFAAAVYLVGYLRSRGVALRWIIAGACWGVAQGFDLIETQFFATTDTPFEVLVVLEEGLEMLGSSLFAWTLFDAGTRESTRAFVSAPRTSRCDTDESSLGDRDGEPVALDR